MDHFRHMLKHYLASLAYRTQKALRDAPEGFSDFRVRKGVRTPHEIVFHMTSVIGYGRTFFTGGEYRPDMLPSFKEEVKRFHGMLASFAEHLENETPFINITAERMLQGPFSDAMTHAGQLAMLRRMYGSAVPPENFIMADVDPANLTPDQPHPVSPDEVWHEPE